MSSIYERVICKFGLDSKRCSLSEPQRSHEYYNYVIKDYSKKLSDDELWNLEETKKRMRKTLGLKLRFYSKSKGRYTSRLYRMVYRLFGVLRAFADDFLDLVTVTLFFKRKIIEDIIFARKAVLFFAISSFITIREQESVHEVSVLSLSSVYTTFLWWIYGKT